MNDIILAMMNDVLPFTIITIEIKLDQPNLANQSMAWYACEAPLGRKRYDGKYDGKYDRCMLNMSKG